MGTNTANATSRRAETTSPSPPDATTAWRCAPINRSSPGAATATDSARSRRDATSSPWRPAHCTAWRLRADGSLVAWGRNEYGQCRVPGGTDFTAISAGAFHNLALKSQGVVVAWGLNQEGQCDVPARTAFTLAAAGAFHSVGVGTEREEEIEITPAIEPVKEAETQPVAADDTPAMETETPVAAEALPETPVADLTATEPNVPADANAPSEDASALLQTIDPNAVAVPDGPAVETADVNVPAATDANVPAPPDTTTTEPRDTDVNEPSDIVPPAEPQADKTEATAFYGSIESYGCINQNDPNARPVYHFTSETLTPHFYTIDRAERDKLIDEQPDVWTYEGRAFSAYPEGKQPDGATPVYRFWSDLLGTHFYTMNESEKEAFLKDYPDLCQYQGIAWYTDKKPPAEPHQTAEPNTP